MPLDYWRDHSWVLDGTMQLRRGSVEEVRGCFGPNAIWRWRNSSFSEFGFAKLWAKPFSTAAIETVKEAHWGAQ